MSLLYHLETAILKEILKKLSLIMKAVKIVVCFFLMVLVSCEKNEILVLFEGFKSPNEVTCNKPLAGSIVSGELGSQNCGLYFNWNIRHIAERYRGPNDVDIDVNGDSIKDFRISISDYSSPGGSSIHSIFSVLNPEFSFSVVPVTYHRCTLADFYYDRNGVLTNFITQSIGDCASFSEEEKSQVDTVYEYISVDNYLLPLQVGDTIGEDMEWSDTPTTIRVTSFESGIWPFRDPAYVAIRRIKSNGQIEYGWIKMKISGAIAEIYESWIQND